MLASRVRDLHRVVSKDTRSAGDNTPAKSSRELTSEAKHTDNLPFRPVLCPNTNSIFVFVVVDTLVDLHEASTQILSPLADLSKSHPIKLFVPRLGGRKPIADAEAFLIGAPGNGDLEEVMDGLDSWIEARHQRSIYELVMTIDGAAVWALRAGKSNAIGRAVGRRLTVLLDEGSLVHSGRHCALMEASVRCRRLDGAEACEGGRAGAVLTQSDSVRGAACRSCLSQRTLTRD